MASARGPCVVVDLLCTRQRARADSVGIGHREPASDASEGRTASAEERREPLLNDNLALRRHQYAHALRHRLTKGNYKPDKFLCPP